MNLRARLSERVHIENIREILHYIQDDETPQRRNLPADI